ncbi:hypothetical protein [Paludibaculum fermentans]|uniref:hypothetical protein n=1 Tax=Paludibaculum fermentans TaxID=1473598 RepID=UPI003EB6D206
MEHWKRCGVALSFALSGAVTAPAFKEGFESHSEALIGLVGLSFGLLVFALIWRSIAGALMIPIIVGTWYLAYHVATLMGISLGDFLYFPMLLGGLIGGMGLSVCRAISQRESNLAISAKICAAAIASAVALGPWLTQFRLHINSPQGTDQTIRLAVGFAVWQGVMGTLLYILRPAQTPTSKEDLTAGSTRILD